MAEVTNTDSGSKRSLNKPRSKKQEMRVDLTPMVDLAFLLIAFFMLTVVFDKPRRVDLDKRMEGITNPIGDCQVLTFLIDSFDQVYTYEGLDVKSMKRTSFDSEHGVRQAMLEKGIKVKSECGKTPAGKERQLFCFIKLLPGSHYKSMVSIMDEASIVLKPGQYSLQEPLAEEVKELEEQNLLAENK